jgi:hypothetical protein
MTPQHHDQQQHKLGTQRHNSLRQIEKEEEEEENEAEKEAAEGGGVFTSASTLLSCSLVYQQTPCPSEAQASPFPTTESSHISEGSLILIHVRLHTRQWCVCLLHIWHK